MLGKMLSFEIGGAKLINIFLFGICIIVASAAYLSEFITLRRNQPNWTMADADAQIEQPKLTRNRRVMETEFYQEFGDKYRLRFKPVNLMPRVFWDKFPQQQQEPTTTVEAQTQPPAVTEEPEMPPEPEPEMPTEAEQEMPTEPEPEMPTQPEPEVPMQPEPEMPPETEAPTEQMTTTTANPVTVKPTSTRTTIMRPPIHFTPHSNTKLKNTFLFGSPAELNIIQKIANTPKSHGKGFLSLFEVIKFENRKCSVAMGDIRTMEGICYHEFECKSLGGIPTQPCAEGIGNCCIFLTGCGNVTDQSIVYFESPNYPNAVREMMICVLVINLRKNVQQLRLDFIMFELNRPTNGDCVDDQFIISGHNLNFNVPVLCGINTGQHIYVHAGNSFERKIYLSFFAKIPNGGRSFNIKITQVEDDLAPEGCLQYYTEAQGVLKSFNYDTEGIIVDNKEATYLNNLNYVMCMQRLTNACSVVYAMELLGGDQLDFQIINKDENENDLVPDGQAGAGIFNCPDDYIAINQVRLCGERFNDGTDNQDFTLHAAVRDYAAGPIMLPVRSDVEYVGRGFRLAYKQEMCF